MISSGKNSVLGAVFEKFKNKQSINQKSRIKPIDKPPLSLKVKQITMSLSN